MSELIEIEEPIVTGLDTIMAVRRKSPEAMLSFSRGKDCIACYLAMQPHFERIVPYYYDFVPDLEFVSDSLAYFEQKMGCHIVRYPASATFRMLKNNMYQPPEHVTLIERFDLPDITQNDLQLALVEDENLAPNSYNAIGMRSKDSVQRAFSIQQNGTINHSRKTFYPVHDMSKDDVINIIKKHGWKLPIDYKYFGSSFDGLYISYLYPIKLFFPRDYQRILEFYPLAEVEVFRYEAAVKAGRQPAYVAPAGFAHPYL